MKCGTVPEAATLRERATLPLAVQLRLHLHNLNIFTNSAEIVFAKTTLYTHDTDLD
jgi:hypothetical protein